MTKQPLYKALYVQVLIGVVLGIAVGHYWPDFGASLKPLGDGFVKLVKMMIAPVVFCTIVSGVASLNDTKEVGKTMLKSMGIFYLLTIIALLIGWAAVAIIEPGVGMHIDPKHLDASVVAKFTKADANMGFVPFVMHIIPHAFFGAFAEGEVLPVLLLAILFGFGLTRIGKAGTLAQEAIESFASVLFAVFGFIMKLAPIGAFGAMAFTVGKYGVGSIGSLGLLIVTFYIACTFFVVVILGALARIHGFSLWKILRYVREELLVVLGTSSSEPVLPRLLQ
ncbi:MAG: cation:dicarboxylase symporter family transporter, partial [Rhodocyclaceae bacterium]|nr:cation:dicarboxylase symporter family transporter [Rhodocyclaceae bacterium]